MTQHSIFGNRLTRRSLATLAGLTPFVSARSTDAQTHPEWVNSTIRALEQPLWTNRDAYDATHHLMIPMHAAYRSEALSFLQTKFEDFFGRFTSAWSENEVSIDNRLTRVQFHLLVSQYLRLKHDHKELSDIDLELLTMLTSAHDFQFLNRQQPSYEGTTFDCTRDLIKWKLTEPDVEFMFHLAMVDLEMFLLSIGADLYSIHGPESSAGHVVEAFELGIEVFRARSTWGPKSEWLFQKGYLWDGSGAAYAGYDEPQPDMEPRPVPGIGGDTSHAHRLPLMLGCFSKNVRSPEINTEIDAMRQGLALQFVNHCLLLPDDKFPGVRVTNYMDGHNGLYRWHYETQGDDNGYRAYELSGTFLLGWWALLESEDIQDAYNIIAQRYPLTSEEINLYVGPNTTRERNSLFSLPQALAPGGMMEATVQSALLI